MNFLSELVAGYHRFTDTSSNWVNQIGGHVGPLTVAAMVVGATVLLAYAVVMLFFRPRNELAEILEPYRLHRAPEPVRAEPTSVEMPVPVLRRAAEMLSGMAEERGVRSRIEVRLARSGLPIGVGEFLLMALAAVCVTTLVGVVVAGVLGLALGFALGVFAPVAVVQLLVERRSRRFANQLPDVVKLLAGSLRAGFSLLQGLDSVVEQVSEPIEHELRRALAAARLGVPIEDALGEVAERVGNRDFAWTVLAIKIQREVGGNLAEVLDTVWETMIQRQRLRREVKTLTAEGRISAIIVAALPVCIGGFTYMVNRPYISQLFDTLTGQVALLGAIAMELLGAWWMYRTIQIEV